MIAGKNDYIALRNMHQGRENGRSGARIGRLHYSLRRSIRKAGQIVLLVRLRDGIQNLVWGHAPFRPLPGVLKEGAVTEERAKLFRPIGTPHPLR
jgi:hypothetical protein